MKIRNKNFVVTGGGNGIGRELVLKLLSSGAKVAAIDINAAGLQKTGKLAGENRGNFSQYVIDVTDREAVSLLPEQVISKWGAVDCLINIAGVIQPFVTSADLNYDDIDRIMNINFYGTVNMTKSFLPHLLTRPEAYVVNASSMGGFLPVPGQGLYGASKAAVKLFTEALYAELLPTNVHVSVVIPGGVSTNIVANSGVDLHLDKVDASVLALYSLTPASKAAQAIIKGIEKNHVRILIGSDAKFMNFLYSLNPKFATKFIAKQSRSLLN